MRYKIINRKIEASVLSVGRNHLSSIVPGGLLVRSYFNMSGPRIAAKVLNMEAAINIGINGIRQAARTSKSIDT